MRCVLCSKRQQDQPNEASPRRARECAGGKMAREKNVTSSTYLLTCCCPTRPTDSVDRQGASASASITFAKVCISSGEIKSFFMKHKSKRVRLCGGGSSGGGSAARLGLATRLATRSSPAPRHRERKTPTAYVCRPRPSKASASLLCRFFFAKKSFAQIQKF